jgi:nicotinamidase-related amidase
VVDGEPDSPVHPEIMALADVVVTSLTGRGKLHSAFDGTLLAQVLGTYPADFVLQVAGLAINGCVKLTALDAATIGYSVEVLVPCCRGSGSEQAKRELLAAGCALRQREAGRLSLETRMAPVARGHPLEANHGLPLSY